MTEQTPTTANSNIAPQQQRTLGQRLLRYVRNMVIFVLIWFAWKVDVFWNYYQFKQLCEAEGGLKVYEKLDKGRGWTVDKLFDSEAKFYAHTLTNAGFFRAQGGVGFVPNGAKEKDLVDIRYLGGPTLPMTSYNISIADLSQIITYKIFTGVGRERSDRVTRYWFEVRDVATTKVMLRSDQFRYNWRTIPVWHWFGPAGQTGCPLPGYKSEDVELINTTAFKD